MPPGAEDSLPPPPPDGRWNSQRSQHVPTVVADPSPGEARRFDSDAKVVRTTRVDPNGLLVTDDDGLLLDFLATLVAKEYILYNKPRPPGAELDQQIVGQGDPGSSPSPTPTMI